MSSFCCIFADANDYCCRKYAPKMQLLLVEPEDALLERAEIEAKVYAKAGEIPHDTRRYRFLALNALA